MQFEISKTGVRHVNASRAKTWQVAGLFFHAFTGDALARRGLITHYVDQHDGSSLDRYEIANTPAAHPAS